MLQGIRWLPAAVRMEFFPLCFAQLTRCIRESTQAALGGAGAGGPGRKLHWLRSYGKWFGLQWAAPSHLALSFLFRIKTLHTTCMYLYKPHTNEGGSVLYLEANALHSSHGQLTEFLNDLEREQCPLGDCWLLSGCRAVSHNYNKQQMKWYGRKCFMKST